MEKRALKRLPANLQARIFYGNMVYAGTVSNLTETGMFICTEMSFAVDAMLVSVVLLNSHSVELPVLVKRSGSSKCRPDGVEMSGIGVSILNPPKEYMDFVSVVSASQ